MTSADRPSYAIFYVEDAYSFRENVMGRQSAGIGFLRAMAATQPKRIWCYASKPERARTFREDLAAAGAPATEVAFVPFVDPHRLAEPGLLYRPDPNIVENAWARLRAASPRAYSLCGVTHTTASHGAMTMLTDLLTAPVESWDALVCTSRAVRDSARTLIERQAEYLRERLGATRLSLPQMPVIPLGVHAQDYAGLRAEREPARSALGIGADRIVVLFVGRLSFHAKAHPLPMYLGLEAAARHAPITLVQAGWFANESIERAFREDAARLCPSVEYRVVDGRDPAALRQAWASADIFTSLSDGIQETFGLTPIEAMAAGLPVVVSDWDGYRDTVRDGIDGFRVATLAPQAGQGGDLADLFSDGATTYDLYCGQAGQFVAVDVEAAGRAYTALATDADLRRRMGEAGRARAAAQFDWAEIFRRYQDLWMDLAERRRSAPDLAPALSRRRRPDREDPFTVFASYPTHPLRDATEFRRRPGAAETAKAGPGLATVSFAAAVLPGPDFVAALLALLPEGAWVSAGEIAAAMPRKSPVAVARTLAWLAKIGAVDFRAGPGPA